MSAGPNTPDAIDASHREYIEELFARHRGSLLRYLSRLVRIEDAGELVQETYFRLLRHGETLRLEAMARAFLFHTATNLARDLRRRRRACHADEHGDIDDEEIAQTHLGPDEYLASEQTRKALEQAIAQLPQETRTVFLLHRFRELSYPQIAKTMNLSTRTVARKMAEAMELLGTVVGASI